MSNTVQIYSGSTLSPTKTTTKPRTTSTSTSTKDPYRAGVTYDGKFVQNQNVGPGGTGYGGGDMSWMARSAPLTVNPGTTALNLINSTNSAAGQTMGSAGDVTRTAWGAPSLTTANPTGTNPYPSYGSTGGGGGGGGGIAGYDGPMLDDATFRAILEQIRRTRPDALTFNPLDLPEYVAPEFYAFDSSPYDTARANLATAVTDDLTRGNQAYADGFVELDQYTNPFAGLRTVDPGVSDAMRAMFAANDVAPNALDSLDFLAQQGNDARSWVNDALAGAADAENAASRRALSGDQRRFTENVGAQERMLGGTIDMQLANALDQYNKDRFAYDADNSRYGHSNSVAEAMANYTRQNQVGDQNVSNQNAWRTQSLQPVLDAMMGGLHNGQNTLDLGLLAQILGA